MSVNKVILVGRLGQDPEMKYTPSGTGVCNFSIATSETWNDKSGQKQERTEWHRIVVWSKLAELCNQYLAKGRQVFVEGKLQTRSWDDQKTGQKKYMTEINATTVQFLGGQTATTDNNRQNTSTSTNTNNATPSQDDGMMSQNYNISNDANFTADDIPF